MKIKLSDIKGFENCTRYIIHENGEVYSSYKKGFLKPLVDSKGYNYIGLRSCNPIIRNPKIHTLVMLAFSDGQKKEQINHIDGIKTNNNLSNLEYVTNRENRIHALNKNLKSEISYGISQHSLDGELISVFDTAKEALIHLGKNPTISGNIGRVIRGERKTAYGYIWKQYEGSTTISKESTL